MRIVKFKISLNQCKNHGLYDSNSSFLDLERNLQKKCQYKLQLGELKNDKNIDEYREWIHKNKKYEKTSISINFDLPIMIINRYGLDKKDKAGKKLFQNENIFTTKQYSSQNIFSKDIKDPLEKRKIDIVTKEALINIPIDQEKNSQNIFSEDISDLEKRKIDTTTKETLINARIGQGKFRSQVMQLWRNKCCVTGSTTIDIIRASHIKPWRNSTDEERLDPYNGLPLTANLDALFDAGLISFESSGILIVSSLLSKRERNIFIVESKSLSKLPNELTEKYLVYHRKYVFRK